MYCCTKEKAQHGTAAPQNNENETENIGKKTQSPSPHENKFLSDWDTLHRSKNQAIKKNVQQSFSLSLIRRPPLSRPTRHRFGPGKVFLTLCHSQPRDPPRVKRGAHCGRRSPARQCCYSVWVPPSVIISPVEKISSA